MMKSFFKKLAFVMALAMVVSMAAPAGSALAAGLSVAYQAGGAVSELNLKAGAEQDLKFLGAPKNWKELGWSWTSSNEAVATVDAAGVVTAVADGTATITITVGDLTGSVTVNVGDAKAYNVTLGTADNKAMTTAELKEGATLDLNFYGVKDWNKNNYTVAWSVSGDAANVDKNGVVTAAKAGKAVVTASIVNNLTGVAHNVTPVEVTVAGAVNPDSFTVAQKDTDKFVLTFATAKTADQVRDGLTVSVKIGDKDYPISFENIAVDGNKVTVTTYARFENDEVYTLTFGKETVSHTIVLGDIYEVRADYYTGKNKDNKVAYVTEEEEEDYVTLVPVLYDEYGNNITAKYNLTNFDFNYEVSENVKPVRIYNDVFAFDKNGVATVDVKATWITDNGDLKEATGKTTFVVEKRGAIALTLQKAAIGTHCGWLAADKRYTYIESPADSFRLDPNSKTWDCWGGWFTNTNFDFRSEEDRQPVYTAIFKDNRGNLVTSNNPAYEYGTFSYESTNNNVLSIEDVTGDVIFNGVGRANILVYFTPADGSSAKKLVASTTINVTPEVYPVTYKMLSTSKTTASDVIDEDLNDVTFKVQFYDQFNNVYERRTSEIEKLIKVEARDTANTVLYVGDIKWNGNDKAYDITFDASRYALGKDAYKSYSYKVSLEDADVTSTVKTPYTVFSLTVKDTLEEKNILDSFIKATKGGIADGVTGNSDVPSNYKFNVAFDGNRNVDVAVKDVLGYSNTNAQSLIKSYWATEIGAKYLSSGNLAIAKVPTYLLVDNTEAKATTGHVGYVYYKVTGPAKTTIAGETVNNNAWGYYDTHGKVVFSFNSITKEVYDYYFEDAEGNTYIAYLNSDQENPATWAPANSLWINQGWSKCLYTKTTGWDRPDSDSILKAEAGDVFYLDQGENADRAPFTFVKAVKKIVDDNLKYAGNGAYSVAFATTRKEAGNLYNATTTSINISNSQSQMKYLGLNPEFDGVTEMDITEANMATLIEEQLLFSYEDIVFGDYYDTADGWQFCSSDVKLNVAASKWYIGTDSVTISKLAFDVTVDEGSGKHTYTSVISVGARIKEK